MVVFVGHRHTQQQAAGVTHCLRVCRGHRSAQPGVVAVPASQRHASITDAMNSCLVSTILVVEDLSIYIGTTNGYRPEINIFVFINKNWDFLWWKWEVKQKIKSKKTKWQTSASLPAALFTLPLHSTTTCWNTKSLSASGLKTLPASPPHTHTRRGGPRVSQDLTNGITSLVTTIFWFILVQLPSAPLPPYGLGAVICFPIKIIKYGTDKLH